LAQHGEELARLRALEAERPLTLLFAARDEAHNSAVVLKEILLCGGEPGVAAGNMSRAELLGFLNSALTSSRTAVKEAKAILKSAAAQILDIQRDEAYASAVLIRLIKSVGGRPDYGIEQPDALRAWPSSRHALRSLFRSKFAGSIICNATFGGSAMMACAIGFRSC
jgi:hypothetical protein